jgi:hypothetical protein
MSLLSTVFLKRGDSAEKVVAELCDAIEPVDIIDWATHWLPARDQCLNLLKAANAPPEAYPQSAHWNWMDKTRSMQGLLALQGLSIRCESQTQGLMRIDLASEQGRLESQRGQPMVYVDYIEIAPWNWIGPYFNPPRFRWAGQILLRAAMEISLDQGFKGRIGLHSLPQSAAFYRRCGLTDCGPDPSYPRNLPYFEATPVQAMAFLNLGGSQ